MWRLDMARVPLLKLLLSGMLALGIGAVLAGDIDADTARQLQTDGQILPLGEMVDRAQVLHPGTVLEVELEREDDRLVYEIEMLGADGAVMELYFNAATGELLEMQRDD